MTGQLDLLDPHGLAEQAERRLTVAELAEAVMGEHERRNTTKAFAADWRHWMAFCAVVQAEGMDIDPLAASSDALVVFARWLASGGRRPDGTRLKPHAPESIRRRITGVLAGWRQHDVDYPRGVSTNARQWVKGYEDELVKKKLPTGRGQAPPLEVDGSDSDAAIRIALSTPGEKQHQLGGYRDLALIFIGFAVGARSAEVAALDVSDITPGERGLYVHVRESKTRSRKPAVIYGQRELTCPVLAWRRWQEASGIITGPAFRRIDRHGNLGGRLSPEACSDIVERAGKRAGVTGDDGKPLRLTGHSLRAGFATAATRAKKDPSEIALQAGWSQNSEAMFRYIRAVKVWQDNVLSGIGL
jgi:integrase